MSERGTSCGAGSRCTARLSVAAGLIRPNWKPACGQQSLGRQRVATLAELRRRTSAWNRWANRTQLKIDWRFSTADARRVFHYQRIANPESKH